MVHLAVLLMHGVIHAFMLRVILLPMICVLRVPCMPILRRALLGRQMAHRTMIHGFLGRLRLLLRMRRMIHLAMRGMIVVVMLVRRTVLRGGGRGDQHRAGK